MRDRIPGLVRSILEDRSEYLWVGTNRGLVRMKDNEFTHYTTKDGLSSLDAMALYEDREGVLWIGTYGGGLNRFKDGKFTNITMGQGLFDNMVYQILEDDRGNFWLSGNKGIFSVSKQELSDFADGRINSVHCTSYGIAEGMRAIECSGAHQPAGWKTRDGRLWFPTTKGVVMIDPEHIPTNTLPPPVYVEQVMVDGESTELSQSINVPPGKRDFEFHYTALSFLDPGKVKFKYRLEGYDENWVEAGTRRTAYYTNIPPGEYRFHVIACNNDGVWNETGAAFQFYLKPRFYQTGWFYALFAMVLALLGPSIYFLRVRQLKAREQELTRIVDERTKELAELNRSLEQRVAEGVEALVEAERMAAYGRMIARVAHDVRRPLFALQTAAYVIEAQCGHSCGREEVRPQLGVLQRATERLANLMDDLLEFVKPKPLQVTRINPAELLEEAVATYRAEHGDSSLHIMLAPAPALPPLGVDRNRMIQALVNLMENAAQHAQGVTTVTLSADYATDALSAYDTPPQIYIRVANDGAGMASENLPHIFDPFFTTGRGTGLGLAIVQQIIKGHGGTITVESQPERGTVFTICLPTEHAEDTK